MGLQAQAGTKQFRMKRIVINPRKRVRNLRIRKTASSGPWPESNIEFELSAVCVNGYVYRDLRNLENDETITILDVCENEKYVIVKVEYEKDVHVDVVDFTNSLSIERAKESGYSFDEERFELSGYRMTQTPFADLAKLFS